MFPDDRPAQQVPESFTENIGEAFQPKRVETVSNKGKERVNEGVQINREMIEAGARDNPVEKAVFVECYGHKCS